MGTDLRQRGSAVDLILSALEARGSSVKRNGDGWIASCPAHADRKPSLSVASGNKGALVHCHAGCSSAAITAALGLRESDLFDEAPQQRTARDPIVAQYQYTDEGGSLLFEICRTAGKRFFQRFPDGQGGWIYQRGTVRRVIYQLPRVIDAIAQGELIFVAEGEKDCHSLAKLDLIATTNPEGAGKWRAAYADSLQGAKLIAIIPDNDPPGLKHADEVARSLHSAGIPAKIVTLPDLPPKGDISDWIGDGHTRTELLELLERSPIFDPAAARPDSPDPFELNDTGNGRRLVAQHGADLRYSYQLRSWLIWDGKRFQPDETGEIDRRAKKTVRALRDEATKTEDKHLWDFARISGQRPKLRALIECAQSEPGIPVTLAELDRDPWLLTLANGTLDLRTGELLPHRREDLSTKLAPVPFDEAAQCPRWLAFLDQIMGGDQELIDFLQRALGYSLTGSTGEQCLFLLHGAGANGKSTFVETVRALLGDYGRQADFGSFLRDPRRSDSGPRDDIAALAGARFVAAVEAEGGRRLSESVIKQLTGGDHVRARRLYQEGFEFVPQFKLWLVANHRPMIEDGTLSIWRRIRLVPFEVQIPVEQQDKRLLGKLIEELPGILIWAAAGCLEWQQRGLAEPESVQAATAAYREEQDPLANWIAEACQLAPRAQAPHGDLWASFLAWADRNSEEPLRPRAFSERLLEHGCRRLRTGSTRLWQGIRLLGSPIQGDLGEK